VAATESGFHAFGRPGGTEMLSLDDIEELLLRRGHEHTAQGSPRVLPSIGIAREVAASALP